MYDNYFRQSDIYAMLRIQTLIAWLTHRWSFVVLVFVLLVIVVEKGKYAINLIKYFERIRSMNCRSIARDLRKAEQQKYHHSNQHKTIY